MKNMSQVAVYDLHPIPSLLPPQSWALNTYSSFSAEIAPFQVVDDMATTTQASTTLCKAGAHSDRYQTDVPSHRNVKIQKKKVHAI
jgi:hypothetical protein